MADNNFSIETRRQVLDRDLHRCVRCGLYLPEAAHLHHRKLRSQGGMGTIENAATLCALCHHWVHGHVAAARAAGLIVPGWADPEATPMYTWRGFLLLDLDGGFAQHTTPYVADW